PRGERRGLVPDASRCRDARADHATVQPEIGEDTGRARDTPHPARSAAYPDPTEGRSSVSSEQQETLDAILRQSALPVGSDVDEQRRLLRELVSAQPLPAEVTVTAATL